MNRADRWQRFTTYLYHAPELGLSLDLSHLQFPDDYFSRMEPAMQQTFDAMSRLEAGSIANPDEQRMVGHYWLRAPQLAPAPELRAEIEFTVRAVLDFAADVHGGAITAPNGRRYTHLLVIGIGGSALGPQFIADALGANNDHLQVHFFDNTDPDGMDRVIHDLGANLALTLCLVISKSGGTKETRNGMLEARAAFERAQLVFARSAVAITGKNSELDKLAVAEGWLARFPMWDWVGGRTSVTSAVGLLPAALQGLDITALLAGAAAADAATRSTTTRENPAALLALMWYYATNGRGERDMVLLPYKDRLILFSRYLQQLIMESIGKEKDLTGTVVNQGLTVYGNKGSTDQHAYVQQLREGINNFFVTFVEVLRDREGQSLAVEPGITSGDYLAGFLQGTREALSDAGRESMTITIDAVTPFTVGVLIALYERAVGLYAGLTGINAYHQPGVEAGKKAAGTVLELQAKVLAHLAATSGTAQNAEEIAAAIGAPERTEIVFRLLRHLAANPDHRIACHTATPLWQSRFQRS
jgi:glucose-6-phosphate isomerase